MQRFKILSGVSLLILTFILATASSFIGSEPEPVVPTVSTEKTKVDKKNAEIYKKRQLELHDALSAYFNKAILVGDIVGAGVSIVKGDSIVVSDGFGKRNINGKEKVNGETVFRLGSLSKGFAGVLAADLKAEGKINWNDQITDYIPEFQFGDAKNTASIKLEHILSHTSGTPYHSFTNLVEAGLPISKIALRFDEVKPISEAGVQYSYQNAMFSLSQEVIKKVTGNEVTTVLKSRFFKPLGMTTVSMNHEAIANNDNVALPHAKGRKGWRSLPLKNRYYNAVVAGGIDASSLDMAKWMRFLLGHNPEVMKKEAVEEVFRPFIELNDNNKYYQRWPGHVKSSYGFGWRIHIFQDVNTNEDITIWHHGGSVNNYRNEIAVYPEADLGICVLLNGNSRLARTVIPDLHEIVNSIYKETAQ